jgi:hypothetical protein
MATTERTDTEQIQQDLNQTAASALACQLRFVADTMASYAKSGGQFGVEPRAMEQHISKLARDAWQIVHRAQA